MKYYDVKKFCELTGMNEKTVRVYISRGTIESEVRSPDPEYVGSELTMIPETEVLKRCSQNQN